MKLSERIGRGIRAFRARDETTGTKFLTLDDPSEWNQGEVSVTGLTSAMKVSAVNAAVEIRSDSFGKLPIFVMDENTKEHIAGHYLTRLLADRPNEAMTPFVFKKLLAMHKMQHGNAYAIAVRDSNTARPRELLPIHPDLVMPYIDEHGVLWYVVSNPQSGEHRKLRSWDVVHLKSYSEDGITGISVLSRAAHVIATARTQQEHESNFYANSARPSGVLGVEGDLSKEARDKVRKEWENIYSGVDNAFRVAVLSSGLKYQPLAISMKDAQFVESKEVTIADIARFYGVPLYKLQSGKQSYDSNEQNAIEYVVSALHPDVQQAEEEIGYKWLFESELRRGLVVKANMKAEMRGDTKAQGEWYRGMREIGAYSVNDILALEDSPAVAGGNTRYASLNYIPLDRFEEISVERAKNRGGNNNG